MKVKPNNTKTLMALAIIGVVMALSLKAGADEGLARLGSGLLWPAVAFLGFAIWRHRTSKVLALRPGGPSHDELRGIVLIARACHTVDGQLLPMPSQDLEMLADADTATKGSLNTQLKMLETKFDISMPRIKEFNFDFQNPKDDLSRSVSSAFDFWDDAGLHLKFPNLWQDATPTGKL